jgi:hypothetical protein
MSHEVYFILDETFDADLWALSRNAHVWLVKSPHNDAAARAVWEKEAGLYSPLFGVTTFDGFTDLVGGFYDLLGTIDQHHDEHSAPEPWSTIHVVGLLPDDVRPTLIADELSLQAVSLEPVCGGFTIRRVPKKGCADDAAPTAAD